MVEMPSDVTVENLIMSRGVALNSELYGRGRNGQLLLDCCDLRVEIRCIVYVVQRVLLLRVGRKRCMLNKDARYANPLCTAAVYQSTASLQALSGCHVMTIDHRRVTFTMAPGAMAERISENSSVTRFA